MIRKKENIKDYDADEHIIRIRGSWEKRCDPSDTGLWAFNLESLESLADLMRYFRQCVERLNEEVSQYLGSLKTTREFVDGLRRVLIEEGRIDDNVRFIKLVHPRIEPRRGSVVDFAEGRILPESPRFLGEVMNPDDFKEWVENEEEREKRIKRYKKELEGKPENDALEILLKMEKDKQKKVGSYKKGLKMKAREFASEAEKIEPISKSEVIDMIEGEMVSCIIPKASAGFESFLRNFEFLDDYPSFPNNMGFPVDVGERSFLEETL